MLERGDHPVIMDFGLAQRTGGRDPSLTAAGAMLGTPAYASPEQVQGETEKIGPATDIYSLGVVLYELLTGRRPFSGDAGRVLAAIVSQSPQPLSYHRGDVDARLEAICLRAMARQAEERFGSMREFADALDQYLRDPQPGAAGSTANEAAVLEQAEATFQRWGWGMGASRIQDLAESTQTEKARAIWKGLADWLKDERNVEQETARRWRQTPLNRWRLVGRAFDALRKRRYEAAARFLEQIERAEPPDAVLEASISHCRGTLLHHQGETVLALKHLHASLEQVGRDHFLGGRILDTLGKTYAAANNFLAAREFFEQAIQAKQLQDDQPGLAVTHGQLGRLFLDWGDFDAAERHFRIDLELAEQLADLRATAMMYNHLGQVFLARGNLDEAAGYLDESLHLCQEHSFRLEEGFVRKDRALVRLGLGQTAAAEEDVRAAEAIFHDRRFEEGLAHLRRVQASILSGQGEGRTAEELLQRSAAWFDQRGEIREAALSWLQLATVRKHRKSATRLVTDALLRALERAERSGRDALIADIEKELQQTDRGEHQRHVYRRSRGRDLASDDTSLRSATSEIATVMCLELIGAFQFVRSENPAIAIATFNQLYLELAPVLERHRLVPTQYLGDGFAALACGSQHAHRAVSCAVELIRTLEEFNRPRRVLRLPEFLAGIGISSGPVVIGNLGTYRKIDLTAVGRPAKVASLLKSEAKAICLSQSTYELVHDHFTFAPDGPSRTSLPGLGEETIWRVEGVAASVTQGLCDGTDRTRNREDA